MSVQSFGVKDEHVWKGDIEFDENDNPIFPDNWAELKDKIALSNADNAFVDNRCLFMTVRAVGEIIRAFWKRVSGVFSKEEDGEEVAGAFYGVLVTEETVTAVQYAQEFITGEKVTTYDKPANEGEDYSLLFSVPYYDFSPEVEVELSKEKFTPYVYTARLSDKGDCLGYNLGLITAIIGPAESGKTTLLDSFVKETNFIKLDYISKDLYAELSEAEWENAYIPKMSQVVYDWIKTHFDDRHGDASAFFKTMALLIQKGKLMPGGVLALEMPDAFMSPDSIVDMCELLTLMVVKMGKRIILTTNSIATKNLLEAKLRSKVKEGHVDYLYVQPDNGKIQIRHVDYQEEDVIMKSDVDVARYCNELLGNKQEE